VLCRWFWNEKQAKTISIRRAIQKTGFNSIRLPLQKNAVRKRLYEKAMDNRWCLS